MSDDEGLDPRDYAGIANRGWQQSGLNLFFEHLRDPSDFAVYACPGAGKTRFAVASAKAALDTNAVDSVVVIAPQANVVSRWRSDFGTLANVEVRQPSGGPALLAEMASREPKNFVITYSALGRASDGLSTAALLDQICREFRTLVILDEVHHMAENRNWGEAARTAFENAAVRLHLSGTPFRSDDEAIPWLMEPTNEGLVVRDPDVSYTYAEAVVDEVCRPIFGHRMIADVTTTLNGTRLLIDLGAVTNEQHAQAALSVATDVEASPDYAFAAIRHGYERLQRIRNEEQPDAGMMIVARDVARADAAARLFREVSQQMPFVAHSGDQGAAAILAAFRNSSDPCLVTVKMASEGYDAQRIRVIVFLTNVRTELNWLQVMGRAIRRQPLASQYDRQDAHVYFPPVPPLEEYMLRMTREANDWIVRNRPDFDGPMPEIDDDDLQLPRRRRRGPDGGRPAVEPDETENVRRDGVILENTQMDEDLCSFCAEVGPYLPEVIAALRPERLARLYLDDPVLRNWVNITAGAYNIEAPFVRPNDLRTRDHND